MSQIFDKIKVGTTKRSTFDLSHTQITTSDFGYLIPICLREMVPNDDFVVKPDVFCRLAPLAVPTYGRVKVRLHHFFVPNRILYPHWDAWLQSDSSNVTTPPFYTCSILRQALEADPWMNKSLPLTTPRGIYARLLNNLGINPHIIGTSSFPSGLSSNERFNAFPFLAYYRIWMDYFADSNIYHHPTLVAEFNDLIKDGGSLIGSATEFLKTRSCCFKKDYFTTAKTSPQDGSASIVGVDIPRDLNPGFAATDANANLQVDRTSSKVGKSSLITSSNDRIGQFTIEALRAANSLQRYLEKNNFVGTKLINRILAHFGVAPTAERLDMAEFIGGSSFPVQIGDVTSTSFDNESVGYHGLGSQAGKGIVGGSGDSVRYHAKEHGIFITLMSILPDTEYYQGIQRIFSRGVTGDPLDYFFPEYENLGYQEILNKEVFVPSYGVSYDTYDPDGIFGYTPRNSDYKFQQSILAGDMLLSGQDTPTDFPMDSWHLFRKFNYDDDYPLALNENFVELHNNDNDYDRIFQVSSVRFDHFYFSIRVDVKATRPMDGFTAPSLDNANTGDGNSINLPYGGTRL